MITQTGVCENSKYSTRLNSLILYGATSVVYILILLK
jgi:hypothetical protein